MLTGIMGFAIIATKGGGGVLGFPTSAVGRESRDGKFPGIPGFLVFPFPGNSGTGSREKDHHKLGHF